MGGVRGPQEGVGGSVEERFPAWQWKELTSVLVLIVGHECGLKRMAWVWARRGL